MRVSMRVVTVTLIAGISGWILRGLQPSPRLAVPRPSAPSAETFVLEPTTIPAISIPASRPRSSAGARNLFAYVTHAAPAPVPRHISRHVTPERPLADEQQPVSAAPEERPKFTHRYIGRFGPDRRPIAAFVREGEIVTVRAGDEIDGTFTLRSIGLESVEIESASGGVREVVRLGR